MSKEMKISIGTDGNPMSVWQIWLRRLCIVMLGWASIEVLLGVLLIVAAGCLPAEVLGGIEGFSKADVQFLGSLLGVSSLVGAAVNIIVGLLGIRGAKNPPKITLFFWIILIDAVLTAWALASSISQGIFDPTAIVSGLFIIFLAICAWQVRKQTGYFDVHP